MEFFKNCYNDIDASNPKERFIAFLVGLGLAFLMILATLDVIGGGVYILGILIGVIK